ncbi:SURF1 family protein [Rhizobium sp. TRM96647]|uniref:SURF1 family protein n=1 Tax=unclassified Rhizobium TaxID=2613769 RepID=UPI00399654D0
MAAGHRDQGGAAAPGAARAGRSRLVFTGAMLLLAAVFILLGTWQVQRLFWKLDLIARVEARIHAQPVPPPPRTAWPDIAAPAHEYLRVTVEGTFDHARAVLVQAVTERGAGFWVMTPLRQADGTAILVNRGFVPPDRRDPASRSEGDIAGPVRVTGLVRMSEPGGGFLRANDPAHGRWYSRDVAAIATATGLEGAAPYFLDADATPNPGGLPAGGLTIVRFRNSHLVYALTWYAMAAMSIGAMLVLGRHARRAG